MHDRELAIKENLAISPSRQVPLELIWYLRVQVPPSPKRSPGIKGPIPNLATPRPTPPRDIPNCIPNLVFQTKLAEVDALWIAVASVMCGVAFGMRGVVRCDCAAALTQPVLGLVYPPRLDPPTPMSPRHRFTLTSSRNPVTTIFLAVSVM